MVEEPQVILPTEEPRYCPACGSRVAAMATTCLMCGASLTTEEATPEETAVRRRLPAPVRVLIVIVLAAVILAALGYGIYRMMNAAPVSVEVTPLATWTPTPTATRTPQPTSTPTITPTPTPIPPLAHQVQRGETLIVIAQEYNTTVEAILALNPDVDPNLLQVGQVLLIPAGTATPAPTPTFDPNAPTPTPGPIYHVVAPGETLITIAEKYGVSVELIRRANNIPIGTDTIIANQTLVIPVGTPVASPTPTVNPNATATPVPPYAAPPLLSPPDGAVLAADKPVVLQWASVSLLRDDEWYALRLFQPSGGVVSVTVYTRATAWHVPPELLLAASGGEQREFRWWVQTVREARDRHGELIYKNAGAPSVARTFIWVGPTPTPTVTRNPTIEPTP